MVASVVFSEDSSEHQGGVIVDFAEDLVEGAREEFGLLPEVTAFGEGLQSDKLAPWGFLL